VSAAPVETIRMGSERARTSFWRGKSDVVLIAPVPGAPVMSGKFVQHCVDTLSTRGFQRAITGALSPVEQAGFIASGFQVEQTLVLLRARLGPLLPEVPPGPRLRAVPRWRRSQVLAVDAAAFPEFWRFDELGLNDALRATPEVAFRMALGSRRQVSGYAISGRAGNRGFVQRLAVHPKAQGAGAGRRLLLDGLRWMVRGGASEAYVNTQNSNKSALALYTSVGFREEPIGLSVLSLGLS
jgi:ribosomal-protein-alanine N-acetyltransferase